jgi:hypothetical protein
MLSLQNIISNPQHHSLATYSDRIVAKTSYSCENVSRVFLSNFPMIAGSLVVRMCSLCAWMMATHRSSTILVVSLCARRTSQMLGIESSWKTLQKRVMTHSITIIFISTLLSSRTYATDALVSSSFVRMLPVIAALVASLKV